MEKKTKAQILNGIKMTMNREDIMPFVSGLHSVQMDMIEMAVSQKEKEGFPEANELISYVMNKR